MRAVAVGAAIFAAMANVMAAGSAEIVRLPQSQLGVDRCAWEPEKPSNYFYSQPQMLDLTSCEQFVTSQHWSFLGAGDSAYTAATQVPTTNCTCGSKTEQWIFRNSMQQYACMGFGYTCTKPGTGCKWWRGVDSATQVSTSMECRSKALSIGGTYYGWEAIEDATKPPESSCVCGEVRTQWYTDAGPSANWQFLCKSVSYECLGRPWFKPPFPGYEDVPLTP